MKRHTNLLLSSIAIITLVASGTACNLLSNRIASGPAPAYTVQPSDAAMESFNSKWRQLSMSTPSGPFSVTFTEEELTSAIHESIRQIEADEGLSIPLDNIQVLLPPGEIYVYGQAHVDPFDVNGRMIIVPSISPSGLAQLEIASIDFGPLQIDQTILDSIITAVEDSINQPLMASPQAIRLDSITIQSNQLTISGSIGP
jgi:hypothetical protein